MEKLTKTDDVIQNLFDPQIKSYKVFVTSEKKQLRRAIPNEAKIKYIEFCLKNKWPEICGENLAKNCAVESFDNNVLTIRTTSSILANELFMMRGLLLQKVNRVLEHKAVVKELKFFTASLKNVRNNQSLNKEEKEEKFEIVKCPACGAKMLSNRKLCSVCERENRSKLQERLMEILKIQPWLSFKECQKLLTCDEIAFFDAKEILQNHYFEKVRLNYASELDKYMAVMLLTGKSADEIDDKIYHNSLEYLRRNQDVSTSRI